VRVREENMSDTILKCPNCEDGMSFDVPVSGTQNSVSFGEVNGERNIQYAGSVVVDEYDQNSLRCRECGEDTTVDQLILAENPGERGS
jgi:hypothetical protein